MPAAEEALRSLHVLCQWPAPGKEGPEDVSMGEFRRRAADTVNSLATSWPGVSVCVLSARVVPRNTLTPEFGGARNRCLKCLGSELATATTWQSAESALMLLRKVWARVRACAVAPQQRLGWR